jgi:hypothetical protein
MGIEIRGSAKWHVFTGRYPCYHISPDSDYPCLCLYLCVTTLIPFPLYINSYKSLGSVGNGVTAVCTKSVYVPAASGMGGLGVTG